MSENIALATELVRSGRLRSASDAADLPMPDAGAVDGARIEGMLLGLCIGDSLGNTTESMVPRDRRMGFGVISDYLPNEDARGRAVGVPSDDTQLAVWTLEHLLANGGLDPAALGEAFASRGRIFGIGSTVRAFLSARRAALHWLDAAQESAGNGALMRIAPLVLPHLASPSRGLWADTLLAGAVTHNDFASNAACVGFVNALWRALRARAPVPRGFWLESFGALAQRVEGDERWYVPRTPGTGTARENMSRFTDRVVRDALSREVSTVEACDGWYSGAFLLETVPSVLYILERHGNDPEEAIVRAVNDTRDNDTVAAIVGAAVGALHGVDALPRRWREGLLGRTGADDDGHVQQTVARARAAFLPKPEASGGVSRRTQDGIRGCLLGGAVGDALGTPSDGADRSGLSPSTRPSTGSGRADLQIRSW